MSDVTPPMRFERVFVEITTICNLNCAFCPGTTRPAARMAPDFFHHVLSQVRPLTDQISLHVLGEPLTHPELPRLLGLCAQTGLRANVTTNGTLIDTAAGRALLGPMVRQVNFSLQALPRGAHFDAKALDEILAFVRLALDQRPDLYINLRLWNQDSQRYQETEHTKRLLDRVAATLGMAVTPPPPGRKSRRLAGRLYLHLDTLFDWPGTAPVRRVGFCHALSSQCAILADGTVCPCCLDAEGRLALGNIRHDDLMDILNGARARAMRDGFQHGRLVESLCQTCGYCRRFATRRAPGATPG